MTNWYWGTRTNNSYSNKFENKIKINYGKMDDKILELNFYYKDLSNHFFCDQKSEVLLEKQEKGR